MQITVISDTHVSSIEELPTRLVALLRKSELIIHLGDYTGAKLVDDLKHLSNFYGVCGNMDLSSLRAILPETQVIEINGKRLGLIHGQGAPWGIDRRIKTRFEQADAVLYGHTHLARNEIHDGTLYFNPGSATGKFPATRKTYGILTIDESIAGEIHTI